MGFEAKTILNGRRTVSFGANVPREKERYLDTAKLRESRITRAAQAVFHKKKSLRQAARAVRDSRRPRPVK
jgi:hypothetical protein